MRLIEIDCGDAGTLGQLSCVGFAPIVLKKSFSPMTENSQDRWCASLAAM
jgi:hypothetical protein